MKVYRLKDKIKDINLIELLDHELARLDLSRSSIDRNGSLAVFKGNRKIWEGSILVAINYFKYMK